MKEESSSLALCLGILGGLCITLWLAGCATPHADWAARVGHYTYEQAVTELGPPDKDAKLADGTLVAEWLTNRGYSYTYVSPGLYGPFSPGYLNTYTAPSQFLRLTFGTNGQLAAWKKVYK